MTKNGIHLIAASGNSAVAWTDKDGNPHPQQSLDDTTPQRNGGSTSALIVVGNAAWDGPSEHHHRRLLESESVGIQDRPEAVK